MKKLIYVLIFCTLIGCIQQPNTTSKGGEECVCKCPPSENMSTFVYIYPLGCPSSICDISSMREWVAELNLSVKEYTADWARGPLVFAYTQTSVGLINPTSKKTFMEGVCNFLKNKKSCDIVEEELKRTRENLAPCLSKYNVSGGTVVFFYSTACHWCKKMAPWVEELGNQTYNFLWIEVQDTEKMKIYNECFGALITETGVPQFICTTDAELHLGAFQDIDALKEFAEKCRKK